MSNFKISYLAGGVLLAAMAVGIQAADMSTTTGIVKGHAPEARGVSISNQTAVGVQPRIGDTLVVNSSYFYDNDGDVKNTSTYQWRRGSTNIGTNSSTYRTVSADENQTLTIQVIPKTNPAITEPSSGLTSVSSGIIVKGAGAALDIDNFIAPIAVNRSYGQAHAYCVGMGARIPTRDEMRQLFVSKTSSPTFFPNSGYITNTEMCSKYGWPVGECGGTRNYWTSTANSGGGHYSIEMIDGRSNRESGDSSYTFQVACIR
ncbi:DUF1566 domain-containing protein [Pseudomonas arsenicoxydans]|uniref:DUF1566 domain-containing protein n=1 Tax=Pseudomonas arsenicoxydans TaxID=702115 RepID=UPI0011298461|nr:DUF1566 domain-containing protein [Pseudomonas arsenicoxydans]